MTQGTVLPFSHYGSFLFYNCYRVLLLLSPFSLSLHSFDRSSCDHVLKTRHPHPLGVGGTTPLPLWLKSTESLQKKTTSAVEPGLLPAPVTCKAIIQAA